VILTSEAILRLKRCQCLGFFLLDATVDEERLEGEEVLGGDLFILIYLLFLFLFASLKKKRRRERARTERKKKKVIWRMKKRRRRRRRERSTVGVAPSSPRHRSPFRCRARRHSQLTRTTMKIRRPSKMGDLNRYMKLAYRIYR